MHKILITLFITYLSLFAGDNTPLNLTKYSNGSLINQHLMYYKDSSNALDYKQALQKFQAGDFKSNEKNRVSFGFTDSTIWLALELNNASQTAIQKMIKIDSAWTDKINLFIINDNKLTKKVIRGDTHLFEQRDNNHRMFYIKHLFEKKSTTLLFKIQSQDPIILPMHIFDIEDMANEVINFTYFYGLLYGVFTILVIYNIAVYFRLKELSYLYYSFYLSAFFLFNLSYTGHGFKYLWSDSIFLQQTMMPMFMYFYILTAIMFTFEFLNLKYYLPKLYKQRHFIFLFVILLSTAILLTENIRLSVSFALFFISFISIFMLILGVITIKHGNKKAMFFVPAILIGSGGATISSGITFGIIPYTTLFFHSVEIGMFIEMTLLALVLPYDLKMRRVASS